MEKIAVRDLQPGMIMAESILGDNGMILVAEGTVLTESLINRLQNMALSQVAICSPGTLITEAGEVLVDKVLQMAQGVLDKYIPVRLYQERENIEGIYQNARYYLEKVIKNEKVSKFYLDLRAIDDFTLQHSINVAVFSALVGVGMHLTPEMMEEMVTAALLHDIGRTRMEPELLQQDLENPLQVNPVCAEHTNIGYKILREEGFSPAIARVALYHHERWDGSGFPQHLKGEKIDLFSRIIMVADVFDTYTGPLGGKMRCLPHEAIEFLYGGGNLYFDARAVKAFIQFIPVYPLGTVVQLSSGEIGIVVNVEKNVATRPIIKVCYDKNKQKLAASYQLDLGLEKTTFITKVLW
ncbi:MULTISPECIES: HD-GYP domain-containing protein [unclassified Carboxydocella]|uniref:HD-GYP domain-containing protein n=1 Tax=unclassified Carboxydocella TaxID=2685367 RepID=UPI0009AD1C61|nr:MULTISPECIES: HD domain-containing phosphohydrolase [unclassified Carboxydocella]GAW30001.1 HDIG domain-containing protein [Carboxydocella sp. ULO1]GAW30396.1 HDIG domain-containing protein [Carboxydocella sp. JDF658]